MGKKIQKKTKAYKIPPSFPHTKRVEEAEIDRQCDQLRAKLLKDLKAGHSGPGPRRTLKSHQVHELAEAKIEESERLRKALKISKGYEEGDHWKRQEERMREATPP